MNGFIAKSLAGLGLSAGILTVGGCYYRDIVDPCWPERYNQMARGSVRSAFAAENANGHVLDQTVWNYDWAHDKDGGPTDVLSPAGIERLQYVSRRRPTPDLHIYLATAQDIPFSGDNAATLLKARQELDQRRCQAIQTYLATQLVPRGIATPAEITVIDPAEVGIAATPVAGTLQPGRELPIIGAKQKLDLNFQGVLPGSTVAGTTGGGGGGGGSGGGGGGSTGGR